MKLKPCCIILFLMIIFGYGFSGRVYVHYHNLKKPLDVSLYTGSTRNEHFVSEKTVRDGSIRLNKPENFSRWNEYFHTMTWENNNHIIGKINTVDILSEYECKIDVYIAPDGKLLKIESTPYQFLFFCI